MKVFLSSTAQDLTTCRQVADDTILRLSQESVRMASGSDVVVCVVAHRYGFVPEPGKALLAWIVADDHPWTEKKGQDLLTDPAVLAHTRSGGAGPPQLIPRR